MANDLAKNEEVRAVLRKQGDDGKIARSVQHYAYFPSWRAEKSYRDFLTAREYKIDRESNESPHANPWAIIFSKVQFPNAIDDETAQLDANAARLGGDYDGWETSIVRSLGK